MKHRNPLRWRPTAHAFILGVGLILGTATSTRAQGLQADINAAAPGDTVRVAAGDYPRPVTVAKDIVIIAQAGALVRLAGVDGSEATVQDIVINGDLQDPVADTVVRAGSRLTLRNCVVQGTILGALVIDDAVDVQFENCRFEGLLTAITVAEAVSFSLSGSVVSGCALGLTRPEGPVCSTADRAPAQRCPGDSCPRILVTGCRFEGGDRQINVLSSTLLEVRDTVLDGGGIGVFAAASRLDVQECDLIGPGSSGDGLVLESASGIVAGSTFSGWANGIVVDDDACGRFSDVVVSGDLSLANEFGNNTTGLRLVQPEWIDADFNYWGAFDCGTAAAQIVGMQVGRIANQTRTLSAICSVRVQGTTWGSLKHRLGRSSP